MKCVICRQGETKAGKTTVTLERGDLTLVFKHVPADICANCGEQYVDNVTSAGLLQTAESSAKTGVQVDIREYKAA